MTQPDNHSNALYIYIMWYKYIFDNYHYHINLDDVPTENENWDVSKWKGLSKINHARLFGEDKKTNRASGSHKRLGSKNTST